MNKIKKSIQILAVAAITLGSPIASIVAHADTVSPIEQQGHDTSNTLHEEYKKTIYNQIVSDPRLTPDVKKEAVKTINTFTTDNQLTEYYESLVANAQTKTDTTTTTPSTDTTQTKVTETATASTTQTSTTASTSNVHHDNGNHYGQIRNGNQSRHNRH